MEPNDANRRDSERVEILGELQGEVMVFQPMRITQISLGGAQVETSFPLPLESLHDFRLTLGDDRVVLKGRVVHCSVIDVEHERVVYRSGVEFVEPPAPAFSALTQFLEAIRSRR